MWVQLQFSTQSEQTVSHDNAFQDRISFGLGTCVCFLGTAYLIATFECYVYTWSHRSLTTFKFISVAGCLATMTLVDRSADEDSSSVAKALNISGGFRERFTRSQRYAHSKACGERPLAA